MTRTLVSLTALLSAACATAPQQTAQLEPTAVAETRQSTKGAVTVAGIPPADVIAAIDTSKLGGAQPKVVQSTDAAGNTTLAIDAQGVPTEKLLGAIDTAKLTGNAPNKGAVTVAGIPPEEVLTAVDQSQLGGAKPKVVTGTDASGQQTAAIDAQGVPTEKLLESIDTRKLVDGSASQTADASAVTPEVQAVIGKGKRYTTRDLALAQLKAAEEGVPG